MKTLNAQNIIIIINMRAMYLQKFYKIYSPIRACNDEWDFLTGHPFFIEWVVFYLAIN